MTLEAAKASIRPDQTVRFKPVWAGKNMLSIPYREGKVVAKYEKHFLVKLRKTHECFTYVDVMLGDVKVVNKQ